MAFIQPELIGILEKIGVMNDHIIIYGMIYFIFISPLHHEFFIKYARIWKSIANASLVVLL